MANHVHFSVNFHQINEQARAKLQELFSRIRTDNNYQWFSDIFVDGDEVVIDADANITLDGVGGTTALNTVIIDCQAVVLPVGLQGTFTVGDETVITVQFDYEAIKEDYSRLRTQYLREFTSNTRTVYVQEQTSQNRTAYVQAA